MTALRTLLSGMADNSVKCVSSGGHTGDPFSSVALPRNRANFDGGATWASDAAVNNTAMTGVGPANIANDWTFGCAAISPDTGNAAFQGGGHSDTGDSSVYTFDIQAAAASINTGGGGGSWALLVPSARYLDAFTQTKPAWSQQPTPTTPTGQNQSYWATTNKNGVQMPTACHPYAGSLFLPGTTKLLCSGTFIFDQNGFGGPGAPWMVDTSTGAATYPMTTTAPAGNMALTYGYAQSSVGNLLNSDMLCPVYNDKDGNLYCFPYDNFHTGHLQHWTNPSNSATISSVDDAVNLSGLQIGGIGFVCFPNPGATSQRAIFQHGISGANSITDASFWLLRGLNGGTITDANHNYSAHATTAGAAQSDYDYDPVRGVFFGTDGAASGVYKVTPSTTLTAWTHAALSPTGDSLTIGVGNGTARARFKWIASQDCGVIVNQSVVWVYRPTGWSPPAEPVVPSWRRPGLVYRGRRRHHQVILPPGLLVPRRRAQR